MKLLNYSAEALIMQNVKRPVKELPTKFTQAQYRLLCKLIRQKKIEKRFFDLLLSELYHLSDWRELNYQQMYRLIHVLTYWNYDTKVK